MRGMSKSNLIIVSLVSSYIDTGVLDIQNEYQIEIMSRTLLRTSNRSEFLSYVYEF